MKVIRTRVWLVGLLAALLIPWTVLVYPDGVSYVFAWGLADAGPVHVTTPPGTCSFARTDCPVASWRGP